MKQFVAFKLSNEIYGVPVMEVQEIIQRPQLTRLPQMPEFVEGVINLRGKIVPVIDLRKRFHMSLSTDQSKARIIVAMSQSIGVVVDSVQGVSNLDEKSIEPVPETIRSIEREYIDGIGREKDGIIILIDLGKILTESEKVSLGSHEEK